MKRFIMIVLLAIILLMTTNVMAQQQEEKKEGGENQSLQANKPNPPQQQDTPKSQEEYQSVDKKSEGQNKDNTANNNKDLQRNEKSEKETSEFIYPMYNSLGLNLSSHSGIGLSYRYHMNNPFLIQVSGGVVSEGEEFFYSFGIEIQKELSKAKDKRAFGALAAGIYGNGYREEVVVGEYYTGMNPSSKWNSDNWFGLAVGVGGELALGSSIIDSISLGCEIYPLGMYIGDKDEPFEMFPGGAVYIFYNF